MRRLLLAAVVAVVVGSAGLAGRTRIASADLFWCADDPVVTIDGQVFNIEVAIARTGLGHVSGDVPIAIILPDDSSGHLDHIDTRYFVPSVHFFHSGQTDDVARFLGVSEGSVAQRIEPVDKGGSENEHAKQAVVLSVVHTTHDSEFPTRLFTDNGDHQTVGESDQLMAIHFNVGLGLHDR
ncbi:MAG: hypothetical protein ACYDCQ_07665 [Dehalococcoidia bacterium]